MKSDLKHTWHYDEVMKIFEQPFNDLLFQAHSVHRHYFHPNQMQVSTLLSIKTGNCAEDCQYCPQSIHNDTKLTPEKLMAVQNVLDAAKNAAATGATRFCMGAAWKHPRKRDMPYLIEMIKGVKNLGLETCMTLGQLDLEQSQQLAQAGLDYYNHNVDTSSEYYGQIITTRTYQDRLNTIAHVRQSGIKVCCGGILGMGESHQDRITLLLQLANLPEHPESVPINMLVKVKGSPLAEVSDIDPFEFIRAIAVARILMPKSYVRLSAGRENMSEEMQALAFFAGANAIFYGEKLLTTTNAQIEKDRLLLDKLGIQLEKREDHPDEVHQAVIAESLAQYE